MIRKSGSRFSEKIMLHQKDGARSIQSKTIALGFLVRTEQPELRRIARRLREAEVAEGVAGDQPAARGPLQQSALDQIRLDDVLDGVARLRQRRGKRLDANGTAAIVQGNGRQVAPVHGVEACGIDFERRQRLVGNGAIDRRRGGDGGEVAHPAQQPSGDARRAARAAGDLVGAVGGDADAEHARARD